jgi:hypothetical protein
MAGVDPRTLIDVKRGKALEKVARGGTNDVVDLRRRDLTGASEGDQPEPAESRGSPCTLCFGRPLLDRLGVDL